MRSRPRLLALALAAVLLAAGAGCSDDDGGTVDAGPGTEPTTEPGSVEPTSGTGVLDAEVLFLGDGTDPDPGDPTARYVDDADEFAELFFPGDPGPVADAVADADLDGRQLVGGVAHTGCFLAGGATLRLDGEGLRLVGTDLDPEEGDVDCARAVVTVVLVSVDTEVLGAEPGAGAPTEPAGDPSDIPVTTVLVQTGARDTARNTPGPGIARDRADLLALYGRFDAGEPTQDLLDRIDRGGEVVIGDAVGDQCEPPVGARLVVDGDDVSLEAIGPETPDDIACDALSQAFVVVIAPVDAVPAGTPVDDDPTGVGVVLAVEPVAADTAPDAFALGREDDDRLRAMGAPDLDAEPLAEGARRLAFVVPGCASAAAELVADVEAGTVHAVLQQAEVPGVECDSLTPYLVVADLDPALADELEPVVAP